MDDTPPITMYDELSNGDKFRNFANEIVGRVLGESKFTPFPSKGKDGGIDAKKIDENKTEIIFQYKFREVARYASATLQSDIRSNFEKWANKMAKEQKGKKCIFITNVCLTAKNHQEFQKIVNKHREKIELEYWEFEKLNFELRKDTNDDIKNKYFPRRTREEYSKMKNALNKLKQKNIGKATKKDAQNARNELKNLFISEDLKYKYYYAFVDLLEPIYLNKDGEEKRANLRGLFDISADQEKEFIDRMVKEKLIKIVGDLCVTQKQEYAIELQGEIMQKGVLDLEIILKLFL